MAWSLMRPLCVAFDHHISYILLSLCLFLVPMELLFIATMCRQHIVTVCDVLLACTAVCDILTVLPYTIHQFLPFPASREQAIASGGIMAWCVMLNAVSHYMVTTLACYRIYHILRFVRDRESWKRIICVISCVTVLVVLLSIPVYANTGVSSTIIMEKTQNGSIRKSTHYVTIFVDPHLKTFNLYVSGIVFKFVPCVAVSVATCVCVRQLLRFRRTRRKSQRQPSALTRNNTGNSIVLSTIPKVAKPQLLVFVMLSFLITQIPISIVALGSIFSERIEFIYQACGELFAVCTMLNGGVFVVIYCFVNSEFQAALRAVFCGRNLETGETLQGLGTDPAQQLMSSVTMISAEEQHSSDVML